MFLSLNTDSFTQSSSNDNEDSADDYDIMDAGKSPPHGGECDDIEWQQLSIQY